MRLHDELGRRPRLADMDEMGKYSQSPFYTQFGGWNDALKAAGLGVNHNQDTSEDNLLAEIDRLSNGDAPPTISDMEERGAYSVPTYYDQFGSWAEALEKAGYDPAANIGNDKIPRSSLIECVKQIGEEIGETPTVRDMIKHGQFSPTAYYNNFESWNAALEAAGFEPNNSTVMAECEICEVQIEITKHRYKKHDRHFCSLNCRNAWSSEWLSGPSNHRWSDPVEYECDNCGAKFERLPHTFDGVNRAFCSRECHREWVSVSPGSIGDSWRDGATKAELYGPNWDSIRESIIKSQNGHCRVCGAHRSELDIDLSVHHITPLKEFYSEDNGVDWESANQEENLVAVCNSCHRRWEGLPVIPDAIKA